MPETWKRDGDEPVKFGRKAKAWLGRMIRAQLFTANPCDPTYPYKASNGGLWDAQAVGMLLSWYLNQPDRYVTWIDDKDWKGSGYPNGSWQLNTAAILGDRQVGVDVVDRQLDAQECKMLDDWLRADIAGDLRYRGERGGTPLVSDELRFRVQAAKELKQSRRVCACGESFTADRRNARRCENCREIARAERSARQNGA